MNDTTGIHDMGSPTSPPRITRQQLEALIKDPSVPVSALAHLMRPRAGQICPTGHGPDVCSRSATRLNNSASGQHEARATRIRLAVSTKRPAIFSRRRRMLANSLCRKGCQDGTQSRTSSSSQ